MKNISFAWSLVWLIGLVLVLTFGEPASSSEGAVTRAIASPAPVVLAAAAPADSCLSATSRAAE